MKTKHVIIASLVGIILVLTMACNLPFIGGGDEGEKPTNENDGVQEEAGEVIYQIVGAPDPKPVTIREGLGSFDSYKIRMKMQSSSSDGTMSSMDQFIESSIIDENSHQIMTNISRDPEDTEEYVESTETYTLGTVTCTYSEGDWDYSQTTLQEKELTDAFSQLADFVPVFNNPEFIGEEVINGINTNHFSFSVTGIGKKSGAVATVNQGDYYLATDGQYLVRYTLELQIQSAPEDNSTAEISNMSISYDLFDVNVPVLLTQPAGCVPDSEQ